MSSCTQRRRKPPAIGSRLKRADFDDVVVFRAVQRHLGIKLSRAQIKVRAEIADEVLAGALNYDIGGPILATEMLYFSSDGDAVELTCSKLVTCVKSSIHCCPRKPIGEST